MTSNPVNWYPRLVVRSVVSLVMPMVTIASVRGVMMDIATMSMTGIHSSITEGSGKTKARHQVSL